ncbi:MAG: ATP/GTP-binding protein [Coriobacteriia bacterium]
MHSLKIVITGAEGRDTSAFIRSVSEITVLSTRRQIGALESGLGEAMPIDMDFGRLTIDEDFVLYLFGTPGDERVAYTWKMLAEGLLGFVVLVDGATNESISAASRTIAFLRDRADVPYVVAVNQRGSDASEDAEPFRGVLGLPEDVPLLYVDIANRQSTKAILAELVDEAMRRTD